MKRPSALLVFGVALLLNAAANADEDVDEFAAGGITFAQPTDVRLTSEDLRISPKAVALRYEFSNDGQKEVEAAMAFPLPDLSPELQAAMGNEQANFVHFRAKVDGKPVAPQLETRVLYVEQLRYDGGYTRYRTVKDVTDAVASAKIDLTESTGALPPEKKR